MTIKTQDRPLEAVREEVIDQLVMNYSHGKLSYEAFERRLDTATESNDQLVIAALAEDLDLKVDEKYTQQKQQDFSVNYQPGVAEESDLMINIFSGTNRGGVWSVAKEIKVFSLFSGATVDFTDAQFSHPVVKIKHYSLFSGDDFYVPENVNVVSKAFCIFGGIDIDTPSVGSRTAPTIIIEGLSIFSGVDIKVKRTLKEKFMSFADDLKNMFS